jgi:hypothetical protein
LPKIENMLEALENVKKAYKKHGFEGGYVVDALKALREGYKSIGDPTLTKVCRLAYEHIEENSDFAVDLFEEREEGDQPSFEYFLDLLSDPDNKFNREEIQEFKQLLLEY